MTSYLKTKSSVAELVRLANKFIDAGHCDDGEELLSIAHDIGGKSFSGNFPSNTLLGSLQALLNDQDISFALIGGVAISVHGLIRSTDDIDALVSRLPDVADPEYAQRFGFYRSKSSTGTVMTIDHRVDGYVELLLANNDLFDYALKTATPSTVLGYSVPIIQPDAIIGMKIRALTNNPAREHKDSIDILAVYKKKQVDLNRVRQFLSEAENATLSKLLGI